MLYYNPHAFFSIIFAVRGNVLPLMVPHACCFAAVGALAAYLVERNILTTDFSEIALICGLVISLVFTFRLNFSFARYEDAVNSVMAIQGCNRRLISRLCAYMPRPEDGDEETTETVLRIRRWLTLTFIFCRARVRSHEEQVRFSELVSLGILTPEEKELMEKPVISSAFSTTAEPSSASSGADHEAPPPVHGERFPSKARVTLVAMLAWHELSAQLRRGTVQTQQFASLDAEVSHLAEAFNRIDTLCSQLLPFAFANMAKTVLFAYMISFPFSVAVDLVWFTPAVCFAQSLLFLTIDKAGSVMDTPFVSSEWFGLDLEKRVRRSDKETAAIVGAWLGAPCPHFDLFPETAKTNLPTRYHEDNIHGSDSTISPILHCLKCWRPDAIKKGGVSGGSNGNNANDAGRGIGSLRPTRVVGPRSVSLVRQATNGTALRGRPRAASSAPMSEPLLSVAPPSNGTTADMSTEMRVSQ